MKENCWPEPNMRSSAYTKPVILKLLRNWAALYFYLRLEKDWDKSGIKKVKKLKIGGDWDNSWAKICLFKKCRTKYLKQSKEEMERNWTGLENFDICFFIFFFRLLLANFYIQEREWPLGYISIQIWDMSDIS